MRYLLLRLKRFCGFITGFVFLFSGVFKLMDPVGTGLIMKEYYDFLHLDFLDFSAKIAGTVFALIETTLGTGLITGVWRKPIAALSLWLQALFTLLTLLLVIFNPDMDCGCFGEAIHLTHAETFTKNLILLILLLVYYIPRKHLGVTTKRKYASFTLVNVAILAFTLYSWLHLPLINYTAYKPGTGLQAGISMNADDIYESVFIYEKNGHQKTFTLDHLPDSTWSFVKTHTKLKDGYEDVYTELSIYDNRSGEYVDTLAIEGKVMIISIYDTGLSPKEWSKVEGFIATCHVSGFKPILLCSMEKGIPESLISQAYTSDYKTLISLNRSNAGVTYYEEGKLIRKWARQHIPDQEELASLYKTDSTEIFIAQDSVGSIGFQGFFLLILAIMLLV